jgi:Uma2 family endonuclease
MVQRIRFVALTAERPNSSIAAMPAPRRWTRKEYDYLVALGILQQREPVELIGGQLIVIEPKAPHAAVVRRVAGALRAVFGRGVVRIQESVALDDDSEPEPDVAVVPGPRTDDYDARPVRPTLIVEVADASLAFDRTYKGSLYARSGVTDYWIVDARRRLLEVHREPVAALAAPFGWRYARARTLKEDAAISPLAAPRTTIAIARLLA